MTKQVIKVYVEIDTIDDYERLTSLLAACFPNSYISSETVTKTLKQLEESEPS